MHQIQFKISSFQRKQVLLCYAEWLLCSVERYKLTPIFWSDGNFFFTTFILFLAIEFEMLQGKSLLSRRLTHVCFVFVYTMRVRLLFYYYAFIFFLSSEFVDFSSLWKNAFVMLCCVWVSLRSFRRFFPKCIEAVVSISRTHTHTHNTARHDVERKKK